MPRKPCSETNRQMRSGISRSLCRISQSSIILHSSVVGPSRNARSSAVSCIGGTSFNFCQSGVPENNSASQPTVPASRAADSVSETGGRLFCTAPKIGPIKRWRTLSTLRAKNTAAGTSSSNTGKTERVWPVGVASQYRAAMTAAAVPQTTRRAFRIARTNKATTASTRTTHSVMRPCLCLAVPPIGGPAGNSARPTLPETAPCVEHYGFALHAGGRDRQRPGFCSVRCSSPWLH